MNLERDDDMDFADLDRIVGAEFDALSGGRTRKTGRRREKARPAREGDQDKVIYPDPFAEKRRARQAEPAGDESDGEVIGFEPRGRKLDNPLFEPEEENFIKSTSDWLRDRANADLVLEEIWRLVVSAQADDTGAGEPVDPDVIDDRPAGDDIGDDSGDDFGDDSQGDAAAADLDEGEGGDEAGSGQPDDKS